MSAGGPGAGALGTAQFELLVNIHGLVAGMAEAQRAARSGTEGIAAEMQKLGGQMRNIGASWTAGVTLPIVGGIAAIIKAGSDYESAFAGIRKTVNATEEEFGVLSDQIRDMATVMPITREELAGIGEVAGQLGVRVQDIQAFIDTSARLGVSTNLSAAEAASAFARLFNITGEGTDQIGKFGAVLVELGNNFATTESEILFMGQRMASVLTTVGVGTGDILAFATALSAMGVQTEAGATAISRAFIVMNTAVAEGGSQLETFAGIAGMAVDDFAELFNRDAAAAMEAFVIGLGNAQDAGVDLLPILEELELDEIRLRNAILALANGHEVLTGARQKAASEAEREQALITESERRFATFASTVQILKNRFSDFGVELFESLRPLFVQGLDFIDDFLNVLGSLVDAFTSLPESVQGTIVAIAGLLAVIGPLAVGAGLLIPALLAIGSTAGLAIGAVTGIAAAGIVLIRHWDDVRAAADNVWGWIEENMPSLANAFTLAVDYIKIAIEGWKLAFEDLFAVIGGASAGIITLVTGLGQIVLSIFEGVAAVLTGLVNLAVAGVEAIKQRSFDPMRDAASQMADDVVKASELMGSGIDNVIDGAVEAATGGAAALREVEFGRELQSILDGMAVGVDKSVQDMIRSWADGEDSFEGFYNNAVEAFQARGISIEDMRQAVLSATTDEERFAAVLAEVTRHTWENASSSEAAAGSIWDYTQSMIEAGRNAAELAAGNRDVAESFVTWAGAQDIMTNAVNSASSAIDTWRTRSDEVGSAMEEIQKQIEATGDPTGELAEMYEYLAGRQDRIANGINDDLIPAWLKQIVNREKLQEVIEAENKLLEENERAYQAGEYGAVGSAEALEIYNRKHEESQGRIADTTKALEDQQDPQKELIGLQQELADAFGEVIDGIRDLMIELGVIPGEVKTDYELTGIPDAMGGAAGMGDELAEHIPPSVETMAVFEAKQAISDFQKLIPWYDEVPEEVETEVEADVSNATEGFGIVIGQADEIDRTVSTTKVNANAEQAHQEIDDVLHAGMDLEQYKPKLGIFGENTDAQEKIDESYAAARALAAESYTVHIKADISEALAGIYVIAEYLPQSPAEKGPLAFTPSWDWVFNQLPSSARYWTDETLGILEQYVNDTLAGVDYMGNELLNKLPAYARDAITAMGGELVRANDIAVEYGVVPDFVDPNAETGPGGRVSLDGGLKESVEEAEEEARETSRAATSWEDEAAKAISLVESALGLLESLGESTVELTPDIEEKISRLVEFTAMVAEHMRGTASGFGPMPEHAEDFFTFANGSTSALSSALDLLNGLSESVADFTRFRFDEEIATLKFIIEKAVISLRDTANLLGTEGLEDANTFMESAQLAMTLMISALDFLNGLSESTANFTRFAFEDHIASLKFIIEKAVVSLRDTSSAIGEMPDGLNDFLESATLSMELMSAALELLNGLSESSGNFSRFAFEEHIASLKFIIEKAVVSLADSAQVMREGYADELTAFNEAALSSVEVMSATLELLEALTVTSVDVTAWSDRLGETLSDLAIVSRNVVEITSAVASDWDGDLNDALELFADAVGNSTSALGDTLSLLEALNETSVDVYDWSTRLGDTFRLLAEIGVIVAREVSGVATDWDGDVNESIADFSEAVGDSSGAMGDVVDLLETLSGSTADIPNPNDIRGIGKKLAEVGAVLADEMQRASTDWEADVNGQLTAFSEAVSASTEALSGVLDLLGMFTQEQDQVQTRIDEEGKRTTTINYATPVNHLANAGRAEEIGRTLAEAGKAFADAINEAMLTWSGTNDESVRSRIAQFAEVVGFATDSIGGVMSILQDEDLKTLNTRHILGSVRAVISAGVEMGTALSTAGSQITDDSLEASGRFATWQSHVESVFSSLGSIMDSMPQHELLATEYRLACERIAADIMAGNASLESAGLDMSLTGPTVIQQAVGAPAVAATATNAPPVPQQVAAGQIVIHNEIGGERVETYIINTVTGVIEKMF